MPSYPANFNSDIPLNGGLVLAYPMLQGAGTSLLDYQKGVNLVGAGGLTAGLWQPFPHQANTFGGGVIQGTGSTSTQRFNAATGAIANNTDLTIAGWFYRRSAGGANFGTVITAENASNAGQYGFYFDNDTSHVGMAFDVCRGSLIYQANSTDTTVNSLNQWVFLVGTFNATTLTWQHYAGTMAKWLGATGVSNYTAAQVVSAITQVSISNSGAATTAWDGYIGPTYVFNRQLAGGEIYQLWQDPYAPVRDRVRVYKLPFDAAPVVAPVVSPIVGGVYLPQTGAVAASVTLDLTKQVAASVTLDLTNVIAGKVTLG